jgi:hypothetical protein
MVLCWRHDSILLRSLVLSLYSPSQQGHSASLPFILAISPSSIYFFFSIQWTPGSVVAFWKLLPGGIWSNAPDSLGVSHLWDFTILRCLMCTVWKQLFCFFFNHCLVSFPSVVNTFRLKQKCWHTAFCYLSPYWNVNVTRVKNLTALLIVISSVWILPGFSVCTCSVGTFEFSDTILSVFGVCFSFSHLFYEPLENRWVCFLLLVHLGHVTEPFLLTLSCSSESVPEHLFINVTRLHWEAISPGCLLHPREESVLFSLSLFSVMSLI